MTVSRHLGNIRDNVRFSEDELVFPGMEDGPRLSQDEWDLRPIVRGKVVAERFLRLTPVVGTYRQTTRELLMALVQPDHPVVVSAGVISPSNRGSVPSLLAVVGHMTVTSVWGMQRGLRHVNEWTQRDVEALLDDLKSGRASASGRPLSPSSLRKHIVTLKDLREFDPVLTGGGFTFMPWGATHATTISGSTNDRENSTPPMPMSMWEPLMRAAWTVVSEFADDIIAAATALRELPARDQGIAGRAAWPAVQAWLAEGNKIPLHTGRGIDRSPRGTVNRSLLFRLARVNSSFVKQTHHNYDAEAVEVLKSLGEDPASVEFGGLARPTALVEHADGTTSTWIDEIGPGEALYLEGVLWAACYIIIASLTGMRDSEIQELRHDCITQADGLDALTSIQTKGIEAEPGEVRTWWAPAAVFTAVRALQRLSRSKDYLFARSEEDLSPYQATKDIRRFTEFVNAKPEDRPGRGRGLGLVPIDLSSRTPITQMTLRRTYSVIAAEHPGAEIGLGINLGHSVLRTTSAYAMDSTQRAGAMFNDERRAVVRSEAARVLGTSVPVSGVRAGEVAQFRGQLARDDTRASSIINAFAETYQVGVFNDCMYRPDRAACGPGGPKLASQHCATSACSNALFLSRHAPTLHAQIRDIDAWIERGLGHPGVLEQLRNERARLSEILDEINQAEGDTDAQ